MLIQANLALNLISFFGAGVLLAFTPCVFPMIPILSSILAGEEKLQTRRAFQLSLTFVLSMAFTYAVAGLLAGYFGSTVQTALQLPWVIVAFSLTFVLMALSMFGYFQLRLPRAWLNYFDSASNRQKRGSYVGVFSMGVLSTLIASPCVTPPLVSVLTYISQTGDALMGALILFSLALGMGLPLLLFGMGQGAFLPKTGVWMDKVKQVFGIMMLGLAIWMLSRILPGPITLFLWSALLMISAVALGALNFHAEKRLPPLLHGLLFFILAYGFLLLIGATSGNDDLLHPLGSRAAATQTLAPAELFTSVSTLTQLKEELAQAKKQHQPTLVEFYASWCGTCRDVDKEVFSDASVQAQLKPFKRLRVDISTKNENLLELIKHYKVFGTPTLIFYDRQGERMETEAYNKGISKETFTQLLSNSSR